MEIANVEAVEAWDGHEGEHWAEHAERYERSSVAAPSAPDQPRDHRTGGPGPRHRVRHRAVDASRRPARLRGIGARDRPVLADARPRAGAGRGRGRRQRHLRAGRRPGAPVRAEAPPTSRSATSAPCSSATRSPPSPTSPAASGPGVGSRCSRGVSSSATSGSPPSVAPSPSGASSQPPRPTPRRRSRWPTRIECGRASPRPGSATSSSSRWTSRWSWAGTPTTRSRSSRTVGIVSGLLDGVDDAGRAEALDNLHAAFKEAETSEGVLLGTLGLVDHRHPRLNRR